MQVSRYRPLPSSLPDGARPATSPVGDPWQGAIHVHSELSDGSGTVEEIAAAAAAAGLDFVVLTDHSPLGPRGRAEDGWYGDVLVVAGEEISTVEGHLLALGVPTHPFRFGHWARAALEDIRELGGFALVAHPHHPEETWTGGWSGVTGMEAFNLAEAWALTGWGARVARLGEQLINPRYGFLRLLAGRGESLALWDRRTRLGRADLAGAARSPARGPAGPIPRPLVGVAAADAHGSLLPGWLPALPRYEDTFASLGTLVWLQEAPAPGSPGAGDKLLAALQAGRAAAAVRALGEPEGFWFLARGPGGRILGPGEVGAWEEGPWTLEASLGTEGPRRLVLLRDGEAVARSDGRTLVHSPEEPGTYRLEAHRLEGGPESRWPVPWVASNPVYLWPEEARQAARLHPLRPPPPPPLSRDLLAAPVWTAESRPEGLGRVLGAEEGPGSGAAAGGLVWELSLPEGVSEDAYAALAWRASEPEDWTRFRGMAVGLQAKETLRVMVQLRCRTAAGQRRIWYQSAKATPGGRHQALPWSGWLPIWGDGAGQDLPSQEIARRMREDLGRVEEVFLLVMPQWLAPGTAARVRVVQLGAYGGGGSPASPVAPSRRSARSRR